MSPFITAPILSLALTVSTPAQLTQPSSSNAQPSQYNVLTWLRMSADSFGCYLEKTFGHKDEKFNCSLKNYKNQGDPCKNPVAYYEGLVFPESKASAIHPLVNGLDVTFEGGTLQSVSVTLNRSIPDPEVRRLFKLPAPDGPQPENVTYISIRKCGEGGTCLYIEGFEHIGAGEAGCGGD